MSVVVYEIRTVETVQNTYTVSLNTEEHTGYDDEELRAKAEALMMQGTYDRVTGSDAHIDEVLSVEEVKA